MNTDSFLWVMRERDEVRAEVSRLRRMLAEAEKKLKELDEVMAKETGAAR